jgi:hypothetical protein
MDSIVHPESGFALVQAVAKQGRIAISDLDGRDAPPISGVRM